MEVFFQNEFNMYSLIGKSVLVTGASSGIGKEISINLSKAGVNVIILGRNAERLDITFNLLSSECKKERNKIISDLTEESNIKETVEKLDNIDAVIHCAGIGRYVPLKYYNNTLLEEFYKINVFAPLLLTKELIKKRKINDGGSIIFISSVMSIIGAKANGIYASTKSALLGAVKCLALELAPNKIRINCISPALVKTPLLDSGIDKGGISQTEYDKDILKHPLGIGMPSDISNVCHFLISDEARWITGTNIIIDGGYSLH
jgi:NAD(P)-dependent dehydrogenase (short-subunit alcohol dehydrogenase family)